MNTTPHETSGPQPPGQDVLADAAEVFQLLSTPGRLHLMWILSMDEVDVTTLTRAVGGTKAAISQHLAKLRLAGWVDRRKEGRRVLYRIADPQIVTIIHQAVAHVLDQRAARPSGRSLVDDSPIRAPKGRPVWKARAGRTVKPS